jgi:hypothetical protein
LEPGGEIVLTTRREDDSIVFEMESHGESRDRHLEDRTVTLCDFVASFHGQCRAESDEQGTLLLALELPMATAHGER